MKNLILIFTIIIASLSFESCAKIGSPTGGAKDSIPPIMIDSKPLNKSIHFDSKKVAILFDEYIKFKNLNEQLIISPPLDRKPEIKPATSISKKISIEFLDSLLPNTTYTINFGNSIVDNNEGNELGKFSYVFSTGDYLDSLSISGIVKDPLTDKEIEDISILAYKNANDTLIGRYTPNYLSNTLKDTFYSLENLSEANYKMIALEDLNKNHKYDKGTERIGFLDRELNLKESDTIDDFVLFKEKKNNKFYRPKQTTEHLVVLGYQGKDKPIVSVTGVNPNSYFINKPYVKDSIYIWYKETPTDSLYINIKQDTVNKNYTLSPRRNLKKDSLILKCDLGRVLHPNDSLTISSSTPIEYIYKDSIQVLEKDSIPIEFTISNNPNEQSLFIDFKRKINNSYSLILKELAFTDILKNPSGKKIIKLETIDPEEYGEIILNLNNSNNINLLVEISKDNFKTKNVKIYNSSGEISFKQLSPGEYQVRIIYDLNSNNQFDNGNFELRIQPEQVYNFEKKIILRANYEINEDINV